MIRNLLATTALATLLATSAYAQETNNNATGTQPAAPATQEAAPATGQNAPLTEVTGHLASDMIGETVYNGTTAEAENIGEVNDLVVSKEGNIESLIIGVGGFLGLGERDVAIQFDQATWADRDGDRLLIVQMTKEQLEGMQPFDKTPYQPARPVAATETQPATGGQATTDQTAVAPAATDTATTDTAANTATQPATETQPATDQTAQNAAPAADGTATTDTAANTATQPATDQTAQNAAPAAGATADTTQTAAIDRSQLKEIPAGEMRAEDIVGTTVYGANDANVGEIGDVVLTADGKVDAYLIDVGGFLGMGEKEVAVSADNLSFMQDANGNRYLYTNFTKEQLDAQAAYDEGTYAQNRDQMRLNVQQQ